MYQCRTVWFCYRLGMFFRRRTNGRRIDFLPEELVVTGERHHGANIERILQANAEGRLEYRCTARLLRERDNESDPNAVAVMVDDVRVGYIARTHSSSVASELENRGNELKCIIRWNGEHSNGIYRVKLFPTF